MRILKANLAYRFYASDGWTREAVQAMYDCDISFVIPRYYDLEPDEKVLKKMTRFVLNEEGLDLDFTKCDYFSVYSLDVKIKVSELKKHTVDFVLN